MKKRIILVLSFLMMAMWLTGCSTKVPAEKIEEMTKIAEEIKVNPTDYKLPEGYSVSNEDGTKLGRIVITTNSVNWTEETLEVSFDITKEEVQLIQIEETYNNVIFILCIATAAIAFCIGVLLAKMFF